MVLKILESRLSSNPDNAQNYASLAFAYYRNGDNAKAIETLRRGAEAAPSFAKVSQCFIDNIEAGNQPDEGC